MPPPRSSSGAETRPAAAEAAARADEMDVTIPVKMPPARTRRPSPAVAEEAERAPTVAPNPIAEPAIPVRAELPEEEPTRLIVPETPVEEVTSSRIAWTGPPKPEKQTLFGALRGRLKSTPRVIAIGIGLAAATAGLGLVLSRTGAEMERVDVRPLLMERAG